MGYSCFRCTFAGRNLGHLFAHLRAVHNIHSSSTYFQCAEAGCCRSFGYIRSFARHLLQHNEAHCSAAGEEAHCSAAGEEAHCSAAGEEAHCSAAGEEAHCSAAGEEAHCSAAGEEAHCSAAGEAHCSVAGEAHCSAAECDVEEWDELEESNVMHRVALFLAKLRANSSQTLTAVTYVVQQTSTLVNDIVSSLRKNTMSFLKKIGQAETPGGNELDQKFAAAAEPFRNLESEYKQMKYFASTGYFVQPVEEPLPGFSFTQRTDSSTGCVRQVAVRDSFQRVPLGPLLKLVLESPGTMEKILAWREQEVCALQDFRDGTMFKTSSLFSKEFAIPLLLYCDECETVNPLGSKTSVHKLGFLYFTLKCLPPEFLSSLSAHFLLAVYKTDDVKTYGIDVVLEPVVNEIRSLEVNGLQIDTPCFQEVVKVGIAQICGDNLGLNAVLGYTESFNAKSVCRWCRVQKEILHVQTVEDESLLRNNLNYQADLCLNNPTETGLKRESALNRLEFYKVVDNVTPDIMHDILEGIGGYEVKLVLNSLIEQKLITLDQINYRLTSFDYGFIDSHNKPSLIKSHELKTPDGALRQTASQTWCLLRLLPLAIGDLIPEGNQYWELLLLLLSCMEFIFSPSLTQEASIFLGYLIQEHHSLFLELYPSRHLKPKHHFMVHYPGAIRKLGPVVLLWAMRFEAKHGFFKRLSHVTCNFRNICKTMAYRHQMLLCYHLLSGNLFTHNVEVGAGCTNLLGCIDGYDRIKHKFDMPLFTEVYVPSWVRWRGTEYRPGMSLLVSHSCDGEPQFAMIESILSVESSVKLIVRKYDTVGFERHYFSYCVYPASELDVVDVNSLDDHHPLHIGRSYKEGDDNLYVSLRYRLF
ncbi:uncharacterized protein LOC111195806 isoform X1 [Astyanax mexicanus]|uniref:uncharacterized protein LOC111195806 isoform X1 n=1 Tax=Astyanax mexicanus TaxID=7994 RepID=UPI0020CB2A2A|nr:uncharacterized protein LOC111195806 isoform X1 [Astyanax mexicanus]XP_049333159.1 uncharacterized protein LOC111195806 isoform X1 [Astyanax mexicanus]